MCNRMQISWDQSSGDFQRRGLSLWIRNVMSSQTCHVCFHTASTNGCAQITNFLHKTAFLQKSYMSSHYQITLLRDAEYGKMLNNLQKRSNVCSQTPKLRKCSTRQSMRLLFTSPWPLPRVVPCIHKKTLSKAWHPLPIRKWPSTPCGVRDDAFIDVQPPPQCHHCCPLFGFPYCLFAAIFEADSFIRNVYSTSLYILV